MIITFLSDSSNWQKMAALLLLFITAIASWESEELNYMY